MGELTWWQKVLLDTGPPLPKAPKYATPAPVGSGPKCETCRTCRYYTRVPYRSGIYPKCSLMRDLWTHGPGTDIKAKWPACRKWKGEDDG